MRLCRKEFFFLINLAPNRKRACKRFDSWESIEGGKVFLMEELAEELGMMDNCSDSQGNTGHCSVGPFTTVLS